MSENISSLHLYKKSSFFSNTQKIKSTKPEFILSISLSGALPLADLKGNLGDVSLTNGATSSKAYYEKWGFSLGLTGKLPAGKKGNFRPKISLYYTSFMNSGTDSSGAVTIEPKLDIVQVSLGAEYAFLQSGNIFPFIEAEATANIFTGSIAFTDLSGSYNFTANYNRNVRYGFAAGAGAEYVFNRIYSIFAGLKFSMANIIGKKYDPSGAHDLDDEAFTVNGFSINRRNIAFLSFYAGVSFGLGN